MKKIMLFFFFVPFSLFAQTRFDKTSEVLKNKQLVYDVVYYNQSVGEFIPVFAIDLVTKQTDPQIFNGSLVDLHDKFRSVSTSPDGMTSASVGHPMEGKALSAGRPCGDGHVYNYGIVVVDSTGYDILFTHKKEIVDFESFYRNAKQNKKTLFFLPSILRTQKLTGQVQKFDSDSSAAEKVLIRRDTYAGPQIGMIVFNGLYSYSSIIKIVTGLDDPGNSKTTHIYFLDGGPTWGQWTKEVNGKVVVKGTRDKELVSNYLVFY